jgi:hypothetical protein
MTLSLETNLKGLTKCGTFEMKVVSRGKKGGGRGAGAVFLLSFNGIEILTFQGKALNKVRQYVSKKGYMLIVDQPVYLSVDDWTIRIQIKPQTDGKHRDGSKRMMVKPDGEPHHGEPLLILPTYNADTRILIRCTLYTKQKIQLPTISVKGNKHAEKHFECFIAFLENKEIERAAVKAVVNEIENIAPVLQPHKKQRVDK